jgi:hypothetical protein
MGIPAYIGGIERGERSGAQRDGETTAKALGLTLSELMEGP